MPAKTCYRIFLPACRKAGSLFQLSYFLFLIAFSSCKFREKTTLLVHHANIYTVDEKFSTAEAMAIRDGKIIAIGSNDDLLKKYEGEETVDA